MDKNILKQKLRKEAETNRKAQEYLNLLLTGATVNFVLTKMKKQNLKVTQEDVIKKVEENKTLSNLEEVEAAIMIGEAAQDTLKRLNMHTRVYNTCVKKLMSLYGYESPIQLKKLLQKKGRENGENSI